MATYTPDQLRVRVAEIVASTENYIHSYLDPESKTDQQYGAGLQAVCVLLKETLR